MQQTVTLSIWGMFMHSDMFMKVLMIAMIAASVWSWTIIIDKIKTFKRIRAESASFERKFWSGSSLEELYKELEGKKSIDPLSAIFMSAMKEWKRSMRLRKDGSFKGVNLQERIEKVMQITIEREAEKLNNRLIFLASTGSVSPLAGLFGTVWGIMASFQAIGVTKNTNIAAVKISPCALTPKSKVFSSSLIVRPSPLGKSNGMPVVKSGAVIINIASKLVITSINGVILTSL